MIKIIRVKELDWRPGFFHNFLSSVGQRILYRVVSAGIGLLFAGFTEFAVAQTAGLVAAYSFDEAAGSLAGDSSATNSHTGTIQGATWVSAGRFGSALRFNGTNALVTVADAADLDLGSGMTLEAWVNPSALSGWRTAILKEKPAGLSYALYAHDNAPRPATYINTGSSDIAASGSSGLSLNAWTHLASTYGGGTLRLYVNGVQVRAVAVNGNLVASSLPLRIGGNAIWGEYFAGLIDEVRVYNRALSTAEIQADMTTPVGLAPTPPPPPSSSEVGEWAPPVQLGLVAVDMIHLHTGKILMFAGENAGGSSATVWDPATGNFHPVPAPYNIFCSGHTALADGRILIVGGHDNAHNTLGSNQVAIFDPVTESWTSSPDVPAMSYRRWYPTATTLADGRVLVTSGATTCFDCIADIPEIYDPVTNTWTRLDGAQLAFPYYPFIFLLPDGRILNAGAGEQPAVTRTLDLATQQWTTMDPTVVDGGSAAMFLPGKIIKSGTAATTDISNLPTSETTYVLDTTRAPSTWQQTAPMAFPRAYHTLTLLPDGKVLATGGGVTTEGKNISAAVYEAEMWNPSTRMWNTMAAMQNPRLYHSTALLLPDGRVVVAGSGDSYGGPDQLTAEFFSPPYLFKGARPAIASAPLEVAHGTTFSFDLADANAIGSVALVRPGSVTHQFDEDQRYLTLTFSQSGNRVSADAPATANLAPPGYYMLFVLNNTGVPSVARWIHLASGTEDTTAPTVTARNPAAGATGVATGTAVTATFSEAMDPATLTSSTFQLRAGSNPPVSATVSYAANTATLTPASALAANTAYTATVKGGSTGVKDLAGNPLAADATWSFTTGSGGSVACTGTSSLWPTNPTPALVTDPDTASVELGVKFRSSVNGFICGIRFYKGSRNTGTHTGKLWSSTGTLLASAPFQNETASGWQQVSFASPVAITANTTYVASYVAPVGRYAADTNFFTAAVTSGPLTALSNAEAGGNGVYRYGSGGFPNSTYQSSNYWVDVLFATN
jgi:hypothetical protein